MSLQDKLKLLERVKFTEYENGVQKMLGFTKQKDNEKK